MIFYDQDLPFRIKVVCGKDGPKSAKDAKDAMWSQASSSPLEGTIGPSSAKDAKDAEDAMWSEASSSPLEDTIGP